MKPKDKKSFKSAFTLIELMVTISIIGLLASTVLAGLATSRQKAVNAKIVAERHEIQNAMDIYHLSHATFPNPNPSDPTKLYCLTTLDCKIPGYTVPTNSVADRDYIDSALGFAPDSLDTPAFNFADGDAVGYVYKPDCDPAMYGCVPPGDAYVFSPTGDGMGSQDVTIGTTEEYSGSPAPTPTPSPTPGPTPPVITSLNQTSGPVESVISAFGSGFSTTGNIVNYAGGCTSSNLSGISFNGTEVHFSIPSSCPVGPITISITNPTNNLTSNTENFTITP